MDARGVPVLPAWGIYIIGLQLAGCLGLSWLGSLLAEVFDGRADLDAAMAGVSLALVPWSLARMVEPVPWLGWLSMVFVVWGGWVLYEAWGACLRIDSGRLAHLVRILHGGGTGAADGPIVTNLRRHRQ